MSPSSFAAMGIELYFNIWHMASLDRRFSEVGSSLSRDQELEDPLIL